MLASQPITEQFHRRPRLNSEMIPRTKNTLEPTSFINDPDKPDTSLALSKQKSTDMPLQPLRNRKKSLALSRKESIEYCSEFRKNNKMHNRQNLLMRLANNLSRNTFAFPYKEINVNIPENVIDWEYIVNPNTDVGYWKNNGFVKLSQVDLDNIINENCETVKNIKQYYQKRLWLYHYIRVEISDKAMQDSSKETPFLLVNRHNVLDDSFNQFLTSKDVDIGAKIQVHFIDEAAHDAGGILREWYDCIYKEIFSEDKKLFIENPNDAIIDGTFLFYNMSQHKVNCDLFYFIGCLLAKTIIDKTNLTETLNITIIKQILDEPLTLDDLKYYDTEIHSSLVSIQSIKDDEQLKEFSFVWNVSTDNNSFEEVELIPNGRDITLKQENKSLFITKAINFILYEQYKKQIDNIKRGFYSLFPKNIIQVFNKEEISFLLTGQCSIDIEDWKKHTIYRGKYIEGENNKTIRLFWEVLSELSESDLVNFYRFCTGTCKVPIDGFGSLKGSHNKIHKFCIEEAEVSETEEAKNAKGIRLIEARTCFNRIYLPEYNNKAIMKRVFEIILGNDTNYFGLE